MTSAELEPCHIINSLEREKKKLETLFECIKINIIFSCQTFSMDSAKRQRDEGHILLYTNADVITDNDLDKF